MIMLDSIQPEQPSREFKNYSENFLNVRLTARTWALMTSTCLLKKTLMWQMFHWRRRGWNGGAEVAETTVRGLLCCGFRRTAKRMGHVYQCRWKISRETNVFSKFEYHMFQVLYQFVTYLLSLPRTKMP
jgi:hypothetical protein